MPVIRNPFQSTPTPKPQRYYGSNPSSLQLGKAEKIGPAPFADRFKRKVLDQLGRIIPGVGEPSESDLTADALMGTVAPLGTTVFHGTGAKPFSKFDWKKYRLSGEGAAAKGEGTYLTDVYDSIAKDRYAEMTRKVTGGGLRPKGTKIEPSEFYDKLASSQWQEEASSLSHRLADKRSALGTVITSMESSDVPGFTDKSFQNALGRLANEQELVARKRLSIDPHGPEYNTDLYGNTKSSRVIRPNDLRTGSAVIREDAKYKDYLSKLRSVLEDVPKSEQGGVLKVHLPDDVVENKFLQWDRSLKEQPKGVVEALKGMGGDGVPDFSPVARKRLEAIRNYWDYTPVQDLAAGLFAPDTPVEVIASRISKWEDSLKNYGHVNKMSPKASQAFLDDANRVLGILANPQKSVARSFYDELLSGGWKTPESLTGQNIYDRLSQSLRSPVQASEAFRKAGIPGQRFLHGMSRRSRDFRPGNYNYVAWDDDVPQIQDYFDWPTMRKWGNQTPQSGLFSSK